MKQDDVKKSRSRRKAVSAFDVDALVEEQAMATPLVAVTLPVDGEVRGDSTGEVMGANEVLWRLSAQARASLAPFLVESEGGLFPDLTTERAQAHLFLLKKAKFKRRVLGGATNPVVETEVELELHDPQAALRDLGRHHKLFTERSESVAVGVLKVEVEYVDRE